MRKFLKSSVGNRILTEIKKIVTDNHYKTTYEPIRIDRSSCRVLFSLTATGIIFKPVQRSGLKKHYFVKTNLAALLRD